MHEALQKITDRQTWRQARRALFENEHRRLELEHAHGPAALLPQAAGAVRSHDPIVRETALYSMLSSGVVLVDPEGRQTSPAEILPIHRPSTDQRIYFPSINRQRHTFRIAFPAVADDGTPTIPADAAFVVLRFAGALGTVDLRWELDHTDPGAVPVPAPAE